MRYIYNTKFAMLQVHEWSGVTAQLRRGNNGPNQSLISVKCIWKIPCSMFRASVWHGFGYPQRDRKKTLSET